jgi:hypothetical protein
MPVLKEHLERAGFSAQYTSQDIQNELINLGGERVSESIIQKV